MSQDVLISQITSSSSASGFYIAQTPTRSNLNQDERQPDSPVASPSHLPPGWHIYAPQTLTRSDAAEAAPRYAADVQADPVFLATQHLKPIPRSVDLYPQDQEVRILGDETAQDYRLQRVPQVAVSGPPKMKPMVQQPMQQLAPPREPTVSAKEQAFIDYWK